MSNLNFLLPSFFRLPESTIATVPRTEGAFLFAEDSEAMYLDTDTKRVPLAPVRTLSSSSELPQHSSGYVYATSDGNLHIYVGGSWKTYTPMSEGEATYMYRFEVVERVDQVSFTAEQLNAAHKPEMDILSEDGTNLSGSDWITRKWDEDSYVLSCTGGWPVGVYYLKISHNVRYDAAGTYIQDDVATAAAISVQAGENYIFTRPLTSMTMTLAGTGKSKSTVTFITADTFQFTPPAGAKYRGAIPTLEPNSEYYIEVHNGILSVDKVVTA